MNTARVRQLEEERRAVSREAKHLIRATLTAERQPTTADRDRLIALLAKTEVIDAELERAFYARPGGITAVRPALTY